jgi:hypothetical protein
MNGKSPGGWGGAVGNSGQWPCGAHLSWRVGADSVAVGGFIRPDRAS